MTLVIDPAGIIKCIYEESIDLRLLGELKITRASLVEPDELGLWWADCSPLRGPKLGPFQARSQALAAEIQWISQQVLDV